MTARLLTVISLTFTGVPITQLEKKKCKKVFFGFFGHLDFVLLHKNVFKKFISKILFFKKNFKCNL
jgi:hypothetical protein